MSRYVILNGVGREETLVLTNDLRRVTESTSRLPRRSSTTMSPPTCKKTPWRSSSTRLLLCSATPSLTSHGRSWTACTCTATKTRLSCLTSKRCWHPSWAKTRSRGLARLHTHHFCLSRTMSWKAWCMAPRRSRRSCEAVDASSVHGGELKGAATSLNRIEKYVD